MTSRKKELSKTSEGEAPDLRAQLRDDPEFRQLWAASAPKRGIAIALVRMRKQAGLTQSDLAKKAGWDKAFVSRLEAALGPIPETATLTRYGAACGQAVGLVFASVKADQAHVIDAVTLAAPAAAHPFERLRGEDLALQDESLVGTGSYLVR